MGMRDLRFVCVQKGMTEKITEQASRHRHLEQKSARELLEGINAEDRSVADAVALAIPDMAALVEHLAPRMREGGRLFYIGAGTSGRLGILDASEIPPTYGAPYDWVIGLIAGGDDAIRRAVENAEDDRSQAWKDLEAWGVNPQDTVLGLSASGATPYVLGGLTDCRAHGISTACIVCNPGAPILAVSDFPILIVTGPEFVTGSTRMKAGTAQKMALNMISTAVMIRLGRVRDNKMVDMRIANDKLRDRGARMIAEACDIDYETALAALRQTGSVREALRLYGKA